MFTAADDKIFVPFVEVLEDRPSNVVEYLLSNTYRENVEKMLQTGTDRRIFIFKEFPGNRVCFKIPSSPEELLILADIA